MWCTDYRPGVSGGGWETKHKAAGGKRKQAGPRAGEGRGECGDWSGPTQGLPWKREGRVMPWFPAGQVSVCEPLPMPSVFCPACCPHSSDLFRCSKSKVVLCIIVLLTASSVFHRKSNIIHKITNKWTVERNPWAKRPPVNWSQHESIWLHISRALATVLFNWVLLILTGAEVMLWGNGS